MSSCEDQHEPTELTTHPHQVSQMNEDWLDEKTITAEYLSDLTNTLGEVKLLTEEQNYRDVIIRIYNYGDLDKAKETFKSDDDKNFLGNFVNLSIGDHMSDSVLLYYVQFVLLLSANICHLILILNIPKGSEDEKDPTSKGFPSECTNDDKGYFIFTIVWIIIFNLASISVGTACWAAMRTNEDGFCKIKALEIRTLNGFYIFSFIFSVTTILLFELKLDCEQTKYLYIPILVCPVIASLIVFKIKIPDAKIILILNKSKTKVIDSVFINGALILNNASQKQRIRDILVALNE